MGRRLNLALLVTALLVPTGAEARVDWRHLLDCLGRGGSSRIAEGRPSQVSGQYRPSDNSVWVWRGPHSTRTLVHELLHRATARRPESYKRAMVALIGDREIDEGLTSYFTDRALERARLQPGLPVPGAGAPFGARRAWARTLREQATAAIRGSFGLEVSTSNVHVLSETSFRRGFERRSLGIWVRPSGGPSYPASAGLVRQLVGLVGEDTLRRAYFEGDVQGLRQALLEAKARVSRREFPRSIDLGS